MTEDGFLMRGVEAMSSSTAALLSHESGPRSSGWKRNSCGASACSTVAAAELKPVGSVISSTIACSCTGSMLSGSMGGTCATILKQMSSNRRWIKRGT